MSDQINVGVVGAGAWGTALAILANRAGSKVSLWTRNQNVYDPIAKRRVNEAYLPEIFIDPAIRVTMDFQEICQNDVLILAVPAQMMRPISISISDLVDDRLPLVIAAKGIERGSLALMSEVIGAIMPGNPLAILSGPNFASDAALGLPTATTLACLDPLLADKLLYAIGGKLFRPYLTSDVVGTQIGGAVKNVIAIACGIAIGRGLGENARAALITRGLAEISRLCIVKGGKHETLMGLSGIGDLTLTCSSTQSRNMSLGIAIGQGKKLEELLSLSQRHGVAEGVTTSESVSELALKLGISMPICNAVNSILSGNTGVAETIQELLERPFASEMFA